tara:strand:+ start:563 stop:763 length:201 start_codon:yes stop_codon:yes gene_type:complete
MPPVNDPVIKLIPTIKLIGKFTVSLIIKLILVLLELFCIPTIKSKNKEKLNVIVKNNFLTGNNIHL